jgi:hypothetical protein
MLSLSLFFFADQPTTTLLSRLGTHYLCRSSEGLNDGLELEVIDEKEEMSDGKAGEAEDNGS